MCEALFDICIAKDTKSGRLEGGMDNMTAILIFFLLNQSWQNFVWDIKQLVKSEDFQQRKKHHEENRIKKQQELAELMANMKTKDTEGSDRTGNPIKSEEIEVSADSEESEDSASEGSESSEESEKTEKLEKSEIS